MFYFFTLKLLKFFSISGLLRMGLTWFYLCSNYSTLTHTGSSMMPLKGETKNNSFLLGITQNVENNFVKSVLESCVRLGKDSQGQDSSI